ncbi:hypothetical protein GCM10025773_39090 [Microbacterium jejuense]
MLRGSAAGAAEAAASTVPACAGAVSVRAIDPATATGTPAKIARDPLGMRVLLVCRTSFPPQSTPKTVSRMMKGVNACHIEGFL